MTEKYGNNKFWCFTDIDWTAKEVAIWKSTADGGEEVIASAKNKYEAKRLVDALLNFENVERPKFGEKEHAFLEFVAANCIEPFSTRAGNAILWNDWDTYMELKNSFPNIY